MTVVPTPTWSFAAASAATPAANDLISGSFSTVDLAISFTANPALCRLNVRGAASGEFDESSQELVADEVGATGSLQTTSVSGCFGLVSAGSPVDLEGTFAAEAFSGSAPVGPINVQ